MKNDSLLTYDEAHRQYQYNPTTGELISRRLKKATSRQDKEGYVRLKIKGRDVFAHRVAFMMYHGYYPEGQIDHINRVKYDNRIDNLREASATCQNRNKPPQSNNSSGVKGVSYTAKTKKWKAAIKINGKWHYLGQYEDFYEAVAHRFAAEQCLNWAGCDSDSPAKLFMLYHTIGI